MRVLIACDKFKGSLSAAGVADAVAAGLPEGWEVRKCPIADGGEGFVEAMLSGTGGREVAAEAEDALGRKCVAGYGVAEISGKRTAFIEMSAASGLWRVGEEERAPWKSSTFGTGQLIRHAVEVSGVERILIGIGGSATNDGGAGMARALGVKFFDGAGVELDGTPERMQHLERVEEDGRIRLPEILVACDVENVLCGPRGATAVFGPQKGVKPEEVGRLDEVLARLAEKTAGRVAAERQGAGAAGGLGFGLMRFAGAELVSGFAMVAEALGLEERIRQSDLVITGEGSLDGQTLDGKGPAGVAGLARKSGVPVVAVAGRVDEAARGLFDDVFSLESFGLAKEDSIRRAAELLEKLVRSEQDRLKGRVGG